MSYLVLARKSRPQNFAEVVGQPAIVKTLQNSIRRGRIAHAILFSGVRGVGKTTLARIMAKAINCQGGTAEPPCNECPSCREINAGSALDLYEIDGASNRGIQEIRELKEKIRFLPTSSSHKIIIIDEVHMLTTEAFNALLKTLEEPPAHVYFMFATTELHKIPITILSRCQQYELKRISAADLTAHFSKLAAAEGVTIEPAALALIVREAEGSVRDGLSLLDQVFSYGEKQIKVADVTDVLGLIDRDVLLRLCHSLLAGDPQASMAALAEIFSYGLDIKRFSSDLLGCFRTLLLCSIDGCTPLLDLAEQDLRMFQDLAKDYSTATIHQKLNLLLRTMEEVRHSSQPRLALETGFLKIIEAGNVIPVSLLLGKLEDLLSQRSAGENQAGSPAQITPPSPTPPPVKPAPSSPPPEAVRPGTTAPQPRPPAPPQPADQPGPSVPPPPALSKPPSEEPLAKPAAALQPPVNVAIHAHEKDVRKHWLEFIEYVKERKVWMAQDLIRSDKVQQVDAELHLHYKDPASCALLRQKDHKKLLTELVLDFFQKNLKVHFVLPQIDDSSDDQGTESPHQKRQQLANDPLTIMAAELFNGQIGDIRIGPRSR